MLSTVDVIHVIFCSWGSSLMGKRLCAMSLEMIVQVYLHSLIGKITRSHIKDRGSSPFFSTNSLT